MALAISAAGLFSSFMPQKSAGRWHDPDPKALSVHPSPSVTLSSQQPCCSIILAVDGGTGTLGASISRLQSEIRGNTNALLQIERLGWAFVSQARHRFDPGYYGFAEQAALCLEQRGGDRDAALLLRGHALQNLHRFKAAEPLAQELAAHRGVSFDHGLLGDVLVELGRTSEAVAAYQRMMDAKPDAQGYTRVAYVRWLTGDLEGAIEVMLMAAAACATNDRESTAWVYSRLAFYLAQSGAGDETLRYLNAALQLRPDYPPALLLRGRLALNAGNTAAAIADLTRAAAENPVPECLWYLAEALAEGGYASEAAEVEARIHRQGEAADPRTFALFLATREESPALAVRAARADLEQRGDAFAHDTLAWALCASGQLDEAQREMKMARQDHTADARLHFHAGIIAARSGNTAEAREFFICAEPGRALLLPSERRLRDHALREVRSLAFESPQKIR